MTVNVCRKKSAGFSLWHEEEAAHLEKDRKLYGTGKLGGEEINKFGFYEG